MKLNRTTSFIAGALAALIVGSGTAYAATGGNFILGRSNSANAQTTLSNTRGTALVLNSTSGTPSLKVNRTTKVPNLNADLIDGLDSTKLALAAGTTRAYTVDALAYDLDDNSYVDTLIARVNCPAGTRRTGGGGSDFTVSGIPLASGPTNTNGWIYMVAVSEGTFEDPSDVQADIVCYSPRGTPAGGYRQVASQIASEPTAEELASARRAVGKADRN